MSEVGRGILWRDDVDGSADLLLECLAGARCLAPQVRLDLAEDHLDGIEVGRVTGQEQDVAAGRMDRVSHGTVFMD